MPSFPALERTANPAHHSELHGSEHTEFRMDNFPKFLNPVDKASISGKKPPDVPVEEGSLPEPPVGPLPNPSAAAGTTRKRGRPKGVKDKAGKRKRRTKQEILRDAASFSTIAGGCTLEEGEVLEEAHLVVVSQLTVNQVMKRPDWSEWEKAISLEEARILSFGTWKAATDEELASAKQILPISIILTVKRCGKRKARAVVLGNLEKDGSVSAYSPVVAQSANRLLLTCAAADADHIIAYDLDSALLNANLDRDVFCRLPPLWQKKHSTQVVKLVKALYGLKDAPKAWHREYCKILTSLGWSECDCSPGLWKKPSAAMPGRFLKKSVHVDDNLATGPCLQKLQTELSKIFQFVSGRAIDVVEYKDVDKHTWQALDFLGADVHYCRARRSFRMTMETYIGKMQKKFDIKIGKLALSPNFDESAIAGALHSEDSKITESHPLREAVGCLQWVATVGRPDAAVPVATLAKYVSTSATTVLVRAVRKVMKFLICAYSEGISYSPEQEMEFSRIYSELLPEGRELPEIDLFSDASFANCAKTTRSTSGSICYYRSTPICWRSNRQSARAYSTAESEHIAASDTIILSETNDFMSFFKTLPQNVVETNHGISPNLENAILWIDDQSAIQTARSTDTKPKSRHYALRYLRVRDAANKIVFCPTNLQKADGLTKLECSAPQSRLILHHISNPAIDKFNETSDSDSEFGDTHICFDNSCEALEYSVYLGF